MTLCHQSLLVAQNCQTSSRVVNTLLNLFITFVPHTQGVANTHTFAQQLASIMPPRSRRDKSASISSIAEAAGAVNGSMPPPSPPSRSSPATRRKTSLGKAGPSAPSIPAPQSAHTPKKPSVAKYLLAVIISLLAEAAAHTVASTFHTGELAIISKRNPSPYTTAGLITWKSTLLALYWFGGFDGTSLLCKHTEY